VVLGNELVFRFTVPNPSVKKEESVKKENAKKIIKRNERNTKFNPNKVVAKISS